MYNIWPEISTFKSIIYFWPSFISLSAFFISSSNCAIENGVTGEPRLECGTDNFTLHFQTEKEFEGHVFVKGHYSNPDCRSDATFTRQSDLSVLFDRCGIERQRSNSPKGVFMSSTIVITFHPMFITKVDRSYHVKCFYMETVREVSTQLEISLGKHQEKKLVVIVGPESQKKLIESRDNVSYDSEIPTELIAQSVKLPVCTYRVLVDGPQGEPVTYATVGQKVYHQWSCDSQEVSVENVYCATVHSCIVKGANAEEVQLLDENGCALDKYLLNNLVYTTDLTGGQISQVFKFADQSSMYFHCQIRLHLKQKDEKCIRTSDDCPVAARGKRSTKLKNRTVSDLSDIDVFSQSMNVFDMDEINESQDDKMPNDLEIIWQKNAICLSHMVFNILFSSITLLLTISTITSIVVWVKAKRTKYLCN